jgi:hypothetical protein
MSNITTTNIDNSSVLLADGQFEDGLLTFGGAATVVEGTILAVDSVSLKYVPFVKGGSTNENGIPKAVLTYDVTATGAGDIAIRAGIKGIVRIDKLIIDADGDGSNVDAAVLDQLRDYGITPQKVTEQNNYDNQ